MTEQTVIIATDASDQAENAVKWYLDHIHRPGNKIVFVHCIELPEMKLNQARSMHMSPGVLASMWKEEEAKSKTLEEGMKELLKQKEAHGVLRTVTGKPGEQITRIAEEENADMIVTGTRGMGKVRRTILGSVSDYLVHHAHCPVVVCRYQSKSRHASGSSEGKKSRNPSGSDKKRHSSGDSFTGQIRARLASLGKSRSASVTSERDEEEDEEPKNGELIEERAPGDKNK